MLFRRNTSSRTDMIEKDLDTAILKENRREQLKLAIKKTLNNKLIMVGGIIVLIILFIAIFAPVLAPHDPYAMGVGEPLAPISKEHPMGTDEFGRDYMSRVFYGARISLQVGLIATAIATFFGLIIGAVAGYYGKGVDNFLMRFMDTILTFPSLLLAIVFLAILGPSIENAMLAIGVVYTPITARVVRSAVLVVKENEYVEAARALGKSNFRILFLEIIPNCLSPLIVQATITFADAIVIEAGLSFLGLSAQIPTASWGKMLSDAIEYIATHVHLSIFPGVAIAITVLGFNLLGDGLRDVLDPRLRRSLT